MPTTATSEDIKRDRRRSTAAMFAVSACAAIAVVLAGLASKAFSADKYTVQVPGGLAFSEFRGYEDWPVISISDNNGKFAAILGNPVMMDALRAGVPGNGKPFPDGAKMAKIHWTPKTQETYPGPPKVPGTQANADFMVKDSTRFADSGGWGWGSFDYDAASDTFSPATEEGQSAAGPRREVRIRVPHTGEEPRLRFHRVRPQVKRSFFRYDSRRTRRCDDTSLMGVDHE